MALLSCPDQDVVRHHWPIIIWLSISSWKVIWQIVRTVWNLFSEDRLPSVWCPFLLPTWDSWGKFHLLEVLWFNSLIIRSRDKNAYFEDLLFCNASYKIDHWAAYPRTLSWKWIWILLKKKSGSIKDKTSGAEKLYSFFYKFYRKITINILILFHFRT